MGWNSAYKGFVASETFAAGDEAPVCTGATRIAASNLIWLWEQSAQVRICMVGVGAVGTLQGFTGRADSADTWTELVTIPFWTRLRPNRSAFLYRVRLAGCVSSAGPSVGFRVAVGATPDAANAAAAAGSAATDCAEVTGITATSFAWLTLDRTVLTMADLPTLQEFPALAPSGEEGSTVIAAGYCSIWSKVSSTAAPVPVLGGLLLAEYVGLSL